jgi:hypothetical protein
VRLFMNMGDFRRGWERNADESDRSVLSYVH